MARYVWNEQCSITATRASYDPESKEPDPLNDFLQDVLKNNRFGVAFGDLLEKAFALGGGALREWVEIPVSDMPEPIIPDDDLIDNADEMSEDYDFLYFSVQTEEDAETILSSAPFLTLPIAVCGNNEAIRVLKKKYCGKIVSVSNNG
jgi:hypothetical protein